MNLREKSDTRAVLVSGGHPSRYYIVHPCLTSEITFSQHEYMIHQVTRNDLGNRLVSVIYSRILVPMYFYFRYLNQNEYFDNVIYLKKNNFVVKVGKTCTDAIALYIDMEIKWGGGIEQNITYTKLDFDQFV